MLRSLTFALSLLLVSLSTTVCTAAPPNIVVIIADDLGWMDLGFQGSTIYETPNLDRLAEQGMRFTDAYASCPVCSPTRASYLTGKTPARLRLTEYIPGMVLPHAEIIPPASKQQLPLEETTLAEQLQAAGYTTVHIGKWHLGSRAFAPEKHGFNLNIGGSHLGMPPSYFAPYRLPNLSEGPKGEHLTDRLANEAARVIEQHRAGPFFVSLCFHAVHTPIQGKPEYVAKYREKMKTDKSQADPTYAAMVQSLDDGVGRVLDQLEALGIADETIVVFTSDNGGSHDGTSNAPLRAGKGHLYEGGIRIPLIVRWPGVVEPGGVSSEPVATIDLMPTLLAAAGAPPVDGVEGVDLSPVLKDADATLAREALCWYYPHYSPQHGRPGGAIRRGRLKLIEFYDTGEFELYDLAADLSETHNLAPARPAEAAQLRTRLHAWLDQVAALPYRANPDYDPKNPRRGRHFKPRVP